MSKIVVATSTTTLFIADQRVHINQGSAWAADSVAVQLHPDLFSDDATHALGLDLAAPAHGGEPQGNVEQATAAPGEKSNARRLLGRRGK